MNTRPARLPILSLAASVGLLLMGCRTDVVEKSANKPSSTATNIVANTPAPVAPAAQGSSASAPEAQPASPPTPVADSQPTAVSGLPAQAEIPVVSTNAPTARVAPQMPELAPAVRELVEMAQASVGEAVLLQFVRNSQVPFEADAEDLVYLKDVGVPDDVVAAMLKRNGELREQGLTAAPPPEAPAATVAGTPVGTAASGTMGASEPAPSVYSQPVTSVAVSVPAPEPAAATLESAPPPPTSNYFYSTLAPYGSWLYLEPYGWCWQPTAAVTVVDWRPYAHGGRWLYTTSGWYWQSYYSWGWAPFHYGNWYASPACGWVWVPGSVWAPAWVTWRYTPAYCGWAPLPPGCGWSAGIGLTYYGSGVSVGFSFGLSSSWYTFVGWDHCWNPYPYRHCVPPAQVVNVYNHSTVINNYYTDNSTKTVINHGVPQERIPASARRNVRRLEIKDVQAGQRTPVRPEQTSLDGAKVAVYRPKVPADLKANSARPDPTISRTPRATSTDAKPSRSGVGTIPTAIGTAPGSSFSSPQRSVNSTSRNSPSRSSTPYTGAASPSAAPQSVGAPTRATPGVATPQGSSRREVNSPASPVRSSPTRVGGTAPQSVPRRTDTPGRTSGPAANRTELAPAVPAPATISPPATSGPPRSGVSRGDPARAVPGVTPMRSQDIGRWPTPSAVPSRSVTAPATSAPGTRAVPSAPTGRASSPAGLSPNRSFAPGSAAPNLGRSAPGAAPSSVSGPTAPSRVPIAAPVQSAPAPSRATPSPGAGTGAVGNGSSPARSGGVPSRSPQVQ